MRVLDLFSGIGGFSLGLERSGMQTVAFCEIDKFCQKVLKKHWPDLPIHDNIKELDGKQYRNRVDVITAGYPCQPDSVAGKQLGRLDKRYIWPEAKRIISEVQPDWVICENVAGHVKRGLETVLSDLVSLAYCPWVLRLHAKTIGANHGRERVWIVAHATSDGCNESAKPGSHGKADVNCSQGQEEDSNNEGCGSLRASLERDGYSPWGWGVEPPALRVDDGLSAELDFIRGVENEYSNDKEAVTEVGIAIREILLYVWKHRALAASSPDLYRRGLYNCLPEMPYKDSSGGWLLGKRLETDQGLRDLWQTFYSKPQQEAQNLQQGLLERIREAKRPKEMASYRADRNRAIGNSVIPQIPELIGRAIIQSTQP